MMKKILLLNVAVALLCVTGYAHDGLTYTSASRQLKDQPPHVEFKHYGFYGIVDLGYLTNFNDNAEMSNLSQADKFSLMGLTAIAGFQWRTEAAVGIGFSYLNDSKNSFSQIPVFIDYRCHFSHRRFSPYVAAQAGWSIPLGTVNSGDEYTRIDKGGITFGVELGGRVAFTAKFGLNLYVGYQMINLRQVARGEEGRDTQHLPELYHALKAGIGFCF